MNLWVLPNECVVDEKNGLIIYDIKPPLSWTYEEYNSSTELIRKYLDYTKSKKTIIPYSCNRLLIFNSKYFHETNNVSMKDGPMNRRVNYTFMFKEIKPAVEHPVYTEIVIGSIPISPIMKDKELKKDLDELKEMMKYVICQMQNLQSRIDLIQQDPMLWVSEYDDCKR